MPYVAPATVVTATTITTAWGNSVKAATDFLANPPACRVYNNAALTHTASGGWQVLSGLNSERYDTDNMHSTAALTTRITFNTAGMYVVGGNIDWAANVTGIRGLKVVLGGVTDLVSDYRNANSAFGTGIAISTVYKFAATNYIELFAFQNSGGNLGITATGNFSPEFYATWIGLG